MVYQLVENATIKYVNQHKLCLQISLTLISLLSHNAGSHLFVQECSVPHNLLYGCEKDTHIVLGISQRVGTHCSGMLNGQNAGSNHFGWTKAVDS